MKNKKIYSYFKNDKRKPMPVKMKIKQLYNNTNDLIIQL